MICRQCEINKEACVNGYCPMCLEKINQTRREKLLDLITELIKELETNNELTITIDKFNDYKKLVQ